MSSPTSELTHETPPQELPPVPSSQRGDWTWELVTQFPRQGEWTEEEYLSQEFDGLVEYVDGSLEFLPMVTPYHQDLVMFLYHQLIAAARVRRDWRIYLSPLRLQIHRGRHREPDLILLSPNHIPSPHQPVIGGQLVMEIVSGGSKDRARDLVEKRRDYAAAGIPEYWIVDPQEGSITVLTLPPGATEYSVHGEFRPGQQATSILLPEFAIDVTACFAAGNPGDVK